MKWVDKIHHPLSRVQALLQLLPIKVAYIEEGRETVATKAVNDVSSTNGETCEKAMIRVIIRN